MSYRLTGAGGAAGLAIGPAFVRHAEPPLMLAVEVGDPATAIDDLVKAQSAASARLIGLSERERAAGRNDAAGILEFLAYLAEDPALTEATARLVASGEPLAVALDQAVAGLAAQIAALDDEYQRERAADVAAVGREIRSALAGERPPLVLPPGAILVAADLSPSETVELPDTLAGFVTVAGSPISHTTILARARGIPAVVGVGPHALEIPAGTELALDGQSAEVLVAPGPAERETFVRQIVTARQSRPETGPALMADGHPVGLWANIGLPGQAAAALTYGAVGVGLFRTEFLFLDRPLPPDEEEQYQAYRATLAALDGLPLVVRTLDIGGDKPLPYLDMPGEPNPALGLRGLRVFLSRPELLVTQLRALLRAAAHGDLRIMLPMVATAEDLAWGRAQLDAAAEALGAEGTPCRAPSFGAMIETPAAAVTVDLLAPLADFFSVGTNDLAQYALAVDRSSGELAARYPADTIALLRLVELASGAARRCGRPLSVCGELASVPDVAVALVGLGVETLSMAATAIPGARARLAGLTRAQAAEQARGRVARASLLACEEAPGQG